MTKISMNVGNQTTLQDLQAFTAKAGDTDRLRGKRNDDGSITLYTRSNKPGMFSDISLKSQQHRKLAHKALEKAMDNTDRQAGKEIVGAPVRAMVPQDKRSELRAGAVDVLSRAGRPVRTPDRGVGLSDFPGLGGKVTDLAKKIASELTDQDYDAVPQQELPNNAKFKETSKAIGEMILESVKAKGGNVESVALSYGNGLKFDMMKHMSAELRKQGVDSGDVAWLTKSLFNEGYNYAASKLLPDSIATDGSLKIGNETYTKVKTLAQGGFGVAELYKSTTSDKQLVLKMPLVPKTGAQEPQLEQAINNAREEIVAHRAALAGGKDHMPDLLGAVRTPDGRIGIALELMPNGDVSGAQKAISKAVKDGHLSPTVAQAMQLTLLQDMAQGLSDLHGAGRAHLDIKEQNYFIGADGVAKIADFGTGTTKSSTASVATLSVPDNPCWVSPEMNKAKDEYAMTGKDAREDTAFRNKLKNQMDTHFAHLSSSDALKMRQKVGAREGIDAQERSSITVDTGANDVWALGVSAFSMMFGRPVTMLDDYTANMNAVIAFGSDGNNRAIDTSQRDAGKGIGKSFAGSTGSGMIDDLLNQMMHPDPSKRPTMDKVLDHPAFESPGVGSKQVYDLIKEFTSGKAPDLNKVQNLSAQLIPTLKSAGA